MGSGMTMTAAIVDDDGGATVGHAKFMEYKNLFQILSFSAFAFKLSI